MASGSATISVLAAVVALIPAATAIARGPEKPPDPTPLGAVPSRMDLEVGAGAPLPGMPSHLLVTFVDAPAPTTARARLRSLGRATPVLPEAGIWALAPRVPPDARTRLARRPDVRGAEWSLTRTSDARRRPKAPLALEPVAPFTDPLFTGQRQWGLLAPNFWSPEITGQSSRPRIAILDSGVDPTHEEWAGGSGLLVAPRSVVRDNADARDWGRTGHGTHVAGIAGAPANGVGIVGAAPARAGSAQIMPVQIADRLGRSTDETMIAGIRWAVRRGARVVNISAGGPGFSRAFQETVFWPADRGALVVASVGNEGDGENSFNYPAGYRRVLGVGALCDDTVTVDCPEPYGPALFSNRNRSVDLLAPGVNVLSSIPVGVRERVVQPGYGLKDGTSMAAPYVAGVAALVQAANRGSLSPYQLLRQLTNTATDLRRRGWDPLSGHGLVNPRAAVTLPAPADDLAEVNDDVKFVRTRLRPRAGRDRVLEATVDEREDPEDVYGLVLRRGERLRARLAFARGEVDLYLWRPGTRTVSTDQRSNLRRNLIRFSGRSGRRQSITVVARNSGVHYLNVFARRGGGGYTLQVRR